MAAADMTVLRAAALKVCLRFWAWISCRRKTICVSAFTKRNPFVMKVGSSGVKWENPAADRLTPARMPSELAVRISRLVL